MKDLDRYAEQLAALGHKARLSILKALLAAHPRGHVAGELQERLGIPASTLSHHLDELRRHTLIEQHREGRFLRYTASERSLTAILKFLLQACCGSCVGLEALGVVKPTRKGAAL